VPALNIESQSPEETREIAARLAGVLEAGDVLWLSGGLGAGKTVFVQGLAKGLGVEDGTLVTSPTFVILHEYVGRVALYHFDFYRLEREQDVDSVGYEEYFEGDGVCAVEWADKFPAIFGPATIKVDIKRTGDETRQISIDGGDEASPRLEAIKEGLSL